MPDEFKYTEMLTPRELRILKDWHAKTVKKHNCDACGQDHAWGPHNWFSTATLFDRNKDQHRHGKVILLASFECKNCGQVKYFRAEKIGFGTKSAPKKHDIIKVDEAEKS